MVTKAEKYRWKKPEDHAPGFWLLLQRLQACLDLGALVLEEGRQRQAFAERLHRLVDGKARSVRGDLEQDAIRLAEIERAEICLLYTSPSPRD